MLQLTCNNDHNTLKAVLEYGEKIGGLGPIWEPSKSRDRAKKYDIENAAKKEKDTIQNEIKQLPQINLVNRPNTVATGQYNTQEDSKQKKKSHT